MSGQSSFSEDHGYVNMHGQDIEVRVCDKTEDIFIPINELKKLGIRIYRKSQYSKFLIDERQLNNDFDLYMLDCAHSYMLRNKVVFEEKDILEKIKNCKLILTNKQAVVPNRTSDQFASSHRVQSADDSFKITTNLRRPLPEKAQTKTPLNISQNGFHKPNQSFHNSSKENRKASDCSVSSASSRDEQKRSRGSRLSEQLQTSNSEAQLPRIPQVEFCGEHEVFVTHSEGPNLFYVQDTARLGELAEIQELVKVAVSKKNNFVPRYVWNQMYLGEQDGEWFRCRVIKFKPPVVLFIDYGNTAPLDKLMLATGRLTEFPAQAVRLTFTDHSFKPAVHDVITIGITGKAENGGYKAQVIKSGADEPPKASQPQEGVISPKPTRSKLEPSPAQQAEAPKAIPLFTFSRGARVMLIGHIGPLMALRTRECFEKFKQINEVLKNVKTVPLKTVQVSQIVLYKKDAPLRAVVLAVEKDLISIELLDCYERISVKLNSLHTIEDSLRLEPVTYVVTQPLKDYAPEMDPLLQEFCDKITKGEVTSCEPVFDMKIEGEELSHKLKTQAGKVRITDLKSLPVSLGMGDYIFSHIRDLNNIFFANDIDLNTYIGDVVREDMPGAAYEPVVGEVCFGLYVGSWCRCAVLKAASNSFEVEFIDFGNTETLIKDELRKADAGTKKVPILGIRCRISGQVDASDLKKVLEDSKSYTVNFKGVDDGVYEIELPDIVAELA